MKELYKSPVVTVEDLANEDVLCSSTQRNLTFYNPNQRKTDNINQSASTLMDLSGLL